MPEPIREVLPAQSRLRDSNLLATTVRRGSRAGRRFIVVHYLPRSTEGPDGPPKVGFAVSKAVGGSVVRHRVVRRLRHVVAAHLSELPDGSSVVVRALPSAASASSVDLDLDLSALLPRLVGP